MISTFVIVPVVAKIQDHPMPPICFRLPQNSHGFQEGTSENLQS